MPIRPRPKRAMAGKNSTPNSFVNIFERTTTWKRAWSDCTTCMARWARTQVAGIAGKRIDKVHLPDKPQGVRGRNSDNTRIRQVLGWEPSTPLKVGLEPTYHWIAGQLVSSSRAHRVKGHRHRPLECGDSSPA